MNDLEFSDSEVKSVACELGLTEEAFEDPERNKIIHNWTNSDIVACPGSGKTTVLLAKLLLLSRHMPLKDGKGLCVLTHTNVAINEIRGKLGQRAEILFKHPNFFGTIQSFIDKFLTIPCCAKTHGVRSRIDNSIYYNILETKYNNDYFPKGYFEPRGGLEYFKKLRYNFDDISIISDGLFKGAFCGKNSNSYKKTSRVKREITKKGVISFTDAFSIANWYLKMNQNLRNFFSLRFKALFIDEMQDTQKHQLEIIENIFNNKVVKQFYGDPDQAIFDGVGGGTSAWKIENENKLEITDSKRFGQSISTCIFPFRKKISKIKGTAKGSIKPYLIIYEKEESALKQFAELITKTHKLNQTEEYKAWDKPSYPFNAVGFVGKHNENKLTIKNYFEGFSKETTSRKFNFSNLVSYFQKRPDDEIQKKGSRIYFQLFVNALIEILDKSNCKNPFTGRNFTKSSLIKLLREMDENAWTVFQENSAKWIKNLHYDEKSPDQIKTEFIEYFKQNLKNKFSDFKDNILNQTFITDAEIDIEGIDKIKKEGNIAEIDGIEIKVGTVHSIKGETHLATLFLETQNYKKFETDYFFNQNSGNLFCNETYQQPKSHARLETRMKTAYVAMSRPSYLLCVALNKSRVKCAECSDAGRNQCNWEIIYTKKNSMINTPYEKP